MKYENNFTIFLLTLKDNAQKNPLPTQRILNSYNYLFNKAFVSQQRFQIRVVTGEILEGLIQVFGVSDR